MRARFLLLVVLASGSCRERSEEPAPAPQTPAPPPVAPEAPRDALTPDEQAIVEKVMEARDEVATIAEANAGDCDKAAREIETVIERNRSLLEESSALEKDPAKRAWIGDKYAARMLASSSKLMALIERCGDHERLERIFESLE